MYEVAHFFLAVEAAVGLAVIDAGAERTHHGLFTPLAFLGQERVFLDFEPPALVFGQMPVEAVDLVEGHQVDVALQEGNVEEMQAAVEVHSAVGEAGLVFDIAAGQRPFHSPLGGGCENGIGKELQDGLQGVERARAAAILHPYYIRADYKAISLFLQSGVQPEDALLAAVSKRVVADYLQSEPGGLFEAVVEEAHGAQHG